MLESAAICVPHPDLDAIGTPAAAQLARFKRPRRPIVVDSLPRTTTGKVQKNLLRDDHGGLVARAGARPATPARPPRARPP